MRERYFFSIDIGHGDHDSKIFDVIDDLSDEEAEVFVESLEAEAYRIGFCVLWHRESDLLSDDKVNLIRFKRRWDEFCAAKADQDGAYSADYEDEDLLNELSRELLEDIRKTVVAAKADPADGAVSQDSETSFERYFLAFDGGQGEEHASCFYVVDCLTDQESDALITALAGDLHERGAILYSYSESELRNSDTAKLIRWWRDWMSFCEAKDEDDDDFRSVWRTEYNFWLGAREYVRGILKLRKPSRPALPIEDDAFGAHAASPDTRDTIGTDPAARDQPVRGRDDSQQAPTAVPPKWSEADSPSRWAKRFGFSLDSLKRMAEAGTIRVKRLSTKSWQIAVDDLPAEGRTTPQN
jgi:hypothetical protein